METSDNDYGDLPSVLKGNTAIFISDTANAPGKIIKEFRKKSDKPVFKGAFINSEISIREKIGLLAYSPLGGGHLTGKYLGGKKPAGSREVLWGNRFDRYRTLNTEPAVKAYCEVAKKHNIDPAQMAIQFCIIQKFVRRFLRVFSGLQTSVPACACGWRFQFQGHQPFQAGQKRVGFLVQIDTCLAICVGGERREVNRLTKGGGCSCEGVQCPAHAGQFNQGVVTGGCQ